MIDQKISALLKWAVLASPMALSANTPPLPSRNSNPTQTTSPRASMRKMTRELAPAPLLQPMGTYVGELQEQWKFPSDHLPIALSFEKINFFSWNVLDTDYMRWVIENSQGLSHSLITDENIAIGDSPLTIRERHVVDLILQAISHPTHPRTLLALQECNKPFIEELRSQLPAHFDIVVSHGEAFLVDQNCFEVIEMNEISGIFHNAPYRTIQEFLVRRIDDQQIFRLINVHLPGDPTKPARFEFAQYLAETFDLNQTTIVMGDMNLNELEMSEALSQGFEYDSPFAIYSPYCTNISPYTFQSKAIDHFFVYSPTMSQATLSTPDQIMPELAPIVELLGG